MTLHSRHFLQIPIRQLSLHAFYESLAAKIDLLAQVGPERIQANAGSHEISVSRDRVSATLGKLPKQPMVSIQGGGVWRPTIMR